MFLRMRLGKCATRNLANSPMIYPSEQVSMNAIVYKVYILCGGNRECYAPRCYAGEYILRLKTSS